MTITKGLTCLGLMTGRGLDDGEEGAVKLANQVKWVVSLRWSVRWSDVFGWQVCTVLYNIEEKRGDFLRLEERRKKENLKIKPKIKSTKQMEKEKADSKWKTSKVIFIDNLFASML